MSMSTYDFCVWLRQYIGARDVRALTCAETMTIRRKLSEVFLHEIDPAMGDATHQTMLNHIHNDWMAR
jgi:hypothetical protein